MDTTYKIMDTTYKIMDTTIKNDEKLLIELDNILFPNEVSHILRIIPTLDYSPFLFGYDHYYSSVWLDQDLAYVLTQRLRQYIPYMIENRSFAQINDAFRVYRYDPNLSYRHTNKDIIVPYGNKPTDKSILSVIIFLNDDYLGGELIFGNRIVYPKLGKVIIYDNTQQYSANRVTNGCPKYELNTNILTYKAEIAIFNPSGL